MMCTFNGEVDSFSKAHYQHFHLWDIRTQESVAAKCVSCEASHWVDQFPGGDLSPQLVSEGDRLIGLLVLWVIIPIGKVCKRENFPKRETLIKDSVKYQSVNL